MEEFADLTLVASNGTRVKSCRFLVGRSPILNKLIHAATKSGDDVCVITVQEVDSANLSRVIQFVNNDPSVRDIPIDSIATTLDAAKSLGLDISRAVTDHILALSPTDVDECLAFIKVATSDSIVDMPAWTNYFPSKLYNATAHIVSCYAKESPSDSKFHGACSGMRCVKAAVPRKSVWNKYLNAVFGMTMIDGNYLGMSSVSDVMRLMLEFGISLSSTWDFYAHKAKLMSTEDREFVHKTMSDSNVDVVMDSNTFLALIGCFKKQQAKKPANKQAAAAE